MHGSAVIMLVWSCWYDDVGMMMILWSCCVKIWFEIPLISFFISFGNWLKWVKTWLMKVLIKAMHSHKDQDCKYTPWQQECLPSLSIWEENGLWTAIDRGRKHRAGQLLRCLHRPGINKSCAERISAAVFYLSFSFLFFSFLPFPSQKTPGILCWAAVGYCGFGWVSARGFTELLLPSLHLSLSLSLAHTLSLSYTLSLFLPSPLALQRNADRPYLRVIILPCDWSLYASSFSPVIGQSWSPWGSQVGKVGGGGVFGCFPLWYLTPQ